MMTNLLLRSDFLEKACAGLSIGDSEIRKHGERKITGSKKRKEKETKKNKCTSEINEE
jgi:hypothetical protein